MISRRCRLPGALLLVVHLGGCISAWKSTTMSPRQVIQTQEPKRVRVSHMDGPQVHISEPTIEGDAIVGSEMRWRIECGRNCVNYRDSTAAIPLSEVRSVDVPQSGSLRVGVGLAVVWGLVELVRFVSTLDDPLFGGRLR